MRSRLNSSGLVAVLLTSAAIIWVLESMFVARHAWSSVDFDLLSYIGIARHISVGEFSAAINGYWSPLFSWILALGFKVSPHALLAAHWVTVITFFSTAIVLYCLTRTIWNSEVVAAVAVLWFVLSGRVVANSIDLIGADLLFATLAGMYFLCAFQCYRRENSGWWLGVGATYAVAFLAKAFAFPWLLLTTTFLLAQIHCKNRKGLVRHATLAFVLPLLVWAGWSTVLQSKYHRFMSGYQFRHQVASMMMKLTWTPPDTTLTTFVDERPFLDEYMVIDPIPPGSSLWTVNLHNGWVARRLMRNEAGNLVGAIRQATILWSPGGWLALVFCGWLLWRGGDRERLPFFALVIFSGIALTCGYALMAVETRYLLPIEVLLIALGARILVPQQVDNWKIPIGMIGITWALILMTTVFLATYRSSPLLVSRDYQAPYREVGAVLNSNPGEVVSYGIPPNAALGIGWEAGYYASFFGGQRLVGFSRILPTVPANKAICTDLRIVAPRSVLVWAGTDSVRYRETLQAIGHCGYSEFTKALDPVDGEIGTVLIRDDVAVGR